MEDLEKISNRPLEEADGAVVFILGTRGQSIEELDTKTAQFSDKLEPPKRDLLLFAIPWEKQGLREALEEILAWDWVAENTPELEGDSTARRELAARRLAAQERLNLASARVFETFSAYQSCTWIWQGQKRQFNSARDLSSFFSHVCDHVYSAAPIVKNELINRRDISPAVVAARRSLVERMLLDHDKARLGIKGYPPEVSIYLSVLKQSGLHRQEVDTWAFGPPTKEDPSKIRPLWRAIDGFLGTTEEDPRPIEHLYEILREPPFGIKDGLLPIYFVAAMLHWKSELALYEKGSFIPEVGSAECERLMKLPDTFSVQRYSLDEVRWQILYKYSTLFQEKIDPRDVSQLTAVQPIIAFVNQLPNYTLNTQALSEAAIGVRESLLHAREPQRLLLKELPNALSVDISEFDSDKVDQYFLHLKRTLVELRNAYEKLLGEVQEDLINALLLSSDLDTARQEVSSRARLLEEWVDDLQLKAFVHRLANTELSHREWLESVASILVHKPPRKWSDNDVLAYRVALMDLAARFRRTEEVVLMENTQHDTTMGQAVRLGVTDNTGKEQRVIVRITPDDKEDLEKAVNALRTALQHLDANRKTRVMAIAEIAKELLATTSSVSENENE